MSKNLLNPGDKNYMLSRIDKLSPASQNLWGRMNVNQMLRHLSDAVKIAFGEVKLGTNGSLFTRTFMRWMILGGVPAPKGKAKTFPEIDEVELGVNPPDFNAERNNLKRQIDRLASDSTLSINPILGRFSREDWARLEYVHMDHHLKQFGV
jgi:uncharacterized protein DUF1569